MIAFARCNLNAKIATACTTGIVQAVSPFSSARNVMAKVNTTALFIERAIEIHGDRYDYSETVWNGAGNPITIICKSCGPFSLAQAETHYSKKACGCRCQGNRKYKTCQCGHVGYGKDFPIWAGGLCGECWEKSKQQRREQRKRTCKYYQTKFHGRHDAVFCSQECKARLSAEKKEHRAFQCKACGKHNEGLEWKCDRPKQFCNLDCQRKHALVDNHSSKGKKDWLEASAIAKRKWRALFSAKRRANNAWDVCITTSIAEVLNVDMQQDRWQIRCHSASNMLGHRMEPSIKFVLKARKTWSVCIKDQLGRVSAKRKRGRQNSWMLKCETKARSLLRRRTLRNARLSM